jgi:hypothetical protein
VAEQLRLEERLGDGGAVDGDEGSLAAVALLVMARASTSFPVPLSLSSTVALLSAIRVTRS